ncbi:coiled-coil domain-containing protein 17 isoform X2 [Apteryx mantelli]|uniref:Coiled-coil domain-containing protein 17 isoform X2 n=1 Tax=Apteryx mantelli TaxID=2696672 RepID=A0ABM4EX34_9AVES
MPGAKTFPCPGCRMRFSSGPLLHKHVERFCIGTLAASGEAPGKAAMPAAASVEREQPRCDGAQRWAPLGRVLTGRERALLRGAWPGPGEPAARRPAEQPPAPQGAPGRPAPRRQELAEAHERRMAEIQARSRQLEQQREGLCRRLRELAGREAVSREPVAGSSRMPEGRGPWGSSAARTPAALSLATLLPAAGPLATEVRALRLAYVQGGGREPAVLAQLLELQVEAAALEQQDARPHRARKPSKSPTTWGSRRWVLAQPSPSEASSWAPAEPPAAGSGALGTELLAVELENRRLEDELLRLKVRRERRADAGRASPTRGDRQRRGHAPHAGG